MGKHYRQGEKLEHIRGTVRPICNGEDIAQIARCVNKVIDYINALEDRVAQLEKENKELKNEN